MVNMLMYIQLFIAVTLIGLILLSRANTDASGAFGQDDQARREKRGAEKTIFRLTIIFAVLFCVSFLVPLFF